ncbi:MAG: NAD(P)/FAD-dependent oxidoreductase [Clostridiales bacterium]|jgi:dihydrolipoamide dehydrogenase|nr:NAD(P)/FAD-dependent oxidoreductase [Clostridiales bacterium]
MQHFDVAVLGAGSGLMIMEGARDNGKTCAVIEEGAFGGTCLNRGCIPSKMLVYPADLIRDAQRGERVGITFDAPKVDWEKVSRRMWRQIDVNKELETEVEETPGVTVFRGRGSFVDKNTLDISMKDGSTQRITADSIVIATGSRTRIPDIAGLEEAGYLTSESFYGDKFPKKPYDSLLIIGGGSTALEMAHIFSAFGTRVTLAVRSETMMRGLDDDLAPFVKKQLEAVGVQVLYFAQAQSIKAENGLKTMTFKDKNTGHTYDITAQEIFLAPGIVPNSDALNLKAAGVETDANGYIITNEQLKTNVPGVYALGDINGKFPLRHKANYEAGVLNNILFGDRTRVAEYDSVPMAVFTHPQVASVGLGEKEARALYGDRVRVFHGNYSDIIAGISMGYSKRHEDDGFAKIITDDNKRLLGVHVVGPQAAMVVQPYAFLMNAGGMEQASHKGTWLPIERAMTIHPTFSELTAWALLYPLPPKV